MARGTHFALDARLEASSRNEGTVFSLIHPHLEKLRVSNPHFFYCYKSGCKRRLNSFLFSDDRS